MKLKHIKGLFNKYIGPKSGDKANYEPKQTQKPMKRSNWRRVGKMFGEV